MQYSLSEALEVDGPTEFDKDSLTQHSDLFAERAALFYTPTANLPERVVGKGPLNVFLPLSTPDFYECFLIRSYMSPKLWVDLLQRHTGFIRWTPFPRAIVTITRCDTSLLWQDHPIAGTKAVLDALKRQTNGRRDGHRLYYFGAILDDTAECVTIAYSQTEVSASTEMGVRISVFADTKA